MDVCISLDVEGLTILRQAFDVTETSRLRWGEIVWVAACKKDCFSIDQIRLEFSLTTGECVLVTEDDGGFAELVDSLPTHLPGTVENWHTNLIEMPAFDGTVQVIFQRIK